MRSILILLSFNLFIVQSIFGQKTSSNEDGMVIGKIVDQQTGKALEYVSVKLFKAADSTLVTGAFTAVDGKYSIPCQFGSFYLKITFTNYDPILVSAITVKTALPIFNVGTLKMRKISEKTEREVKVIAEKDVLKAGIDKKNIQRCRRFKCSRRDSK